MFSILCLFEPIVFFKKFQKTYFVSVKITADLSELYFYVHFYFSPSIFLEKCTGKNLFLRPKIR